MSDSIAPSTEQRPAPNAAVHIRNLRFAWTREASAHLDIPELRIPAGQTHFLKGPSGSGKSTLLALLAGLMPPDQGSIAVAGTAIERLPRRKRDRFRADHLGVIFQQFNLVPYLSPLENILLPCRFSRRRRQQAGADLKDSADELMRALGLVPDKLPRDVRELSIGQQQRIASARALIGDPELILADEPTSALDAAHRDQFVALLLEQAQRHHSTVVFVSHDEPLAERFEVTRDIRDWWKEHAHD